jgi:hypothetical protein
MVLNILKSISINRGKRAKHGKYTKRKGRVRVYHQKYKKHYTRKYGKRIQRRRRTRSKKGGELTLNIPNMNTPVTILYRYFARITKPNVDSFSEDNKQEQIIMYTQQGKPNSIFIARCPSKDCSTETGAQIMELDYKSLKKDASNREYFFISGGKKYKMKIDDDGVGGVEGVGETLLDVFKESTIPKESAEAPVEAPVEAPAKTLESSVKESVEAPVGVETPQMSEKDRKFQELIDSINFKNPTIDDIKKMLKVTNPFDTMCSFLCNPDNPDNPDDCDEQMLEKLRKKYMEKITQNNVSKIKDATKIFDDVLNENLFLILENLYIQSKKMKKEEFKNLVNTCSAAIAQTFDKKNNLHKIVFILYSKFLKSYEISENESRQNLENMKKLLDLLNSMTPENMKKLLDLLNSMTPENMKKLLDLLNSMTPENMGIILQALNTKFNISNSGVLLATSDHSIGLLLSDHLKLNEESMSKLLDFYSFSEIKKSLYPTGKIVRYDFICHKYKGGKTPFLKIISIGKEESSTCKAIDVLNKSIEIFTPFLKHMHGEKNKDNVEIRNEYDAKLFKADNECRVRYYQGGGKRKTLKIRHVKN